MLTCAGVCTTVMDFSICGKLDSSSYCTVMSPLDCIVDLLFGTSQCDSELNSKLLFKPVYYLLVSQI